MVYTTKRLAMVRDFLRARNIQDERILNAFEEIPRHLFVEEVIRSEAYGDRPLPIGHQQTISQPYIVALMLELLRPEAGDRVLEIGTGSGYQTAILSRLVSQVYSVERIPDLARSAKEVLDELGVLNATVKVFDGTYGWSDKSPYDGIIVSAASPSIPEPLKKQLAVGGRLVIPVGGESSQVVTIVTRTADESYTAEERELCVFVKLLGRYGWKE